MNKITETIVQFTVSEKSADNAWAGLSTEIVQAVLRRSISYQRESVKDFLRPFEDEYMEAYHSEDTAAKKKNGAWKYSNYLPNAYRSAKSVICRAADTGTSLQSGIDVVRGKSAVEKDIQSHIEASTSTTEDVNAAINKHIKALKGYDIAGYHAEVIGMIKATWLVTGE